MRRPFILVAHAAAMFGLLWYVSHHWFWHDEPLRQRVMLVQSGDEPHYLVTMQSLAFDGDLDVTDDYLAATRGGPEAGAHLRDVKMDHHSFWVDPATGAHHRWWDLFDHERHIPCAGNACTPFEAKVPGLPSAGMIERPLHPAGWPALLTLVVLPFRPTPETLEEMAGVAITVMIWLTAIVAFVCALGFGLADRWALVVAWSLLAGSTLLAYSRSFFPEAGLALMVALALWALRRDRWWAMAIALTVAVVIKPNFGLIGAAFAIDLWLRHKRALAVKFSAAFGVGVVVFYLAFTKWLLGAWLLPQPAGTFWPLSFASLHVTLTSQSHGLFLFDPWVVVALGFSAFAGWKHPTLRADLRQLLMPCAFWLVLSCGAKVHPGFCYGPRYWVPLLVFLALAGWLSARAMGRAATAVLAVVFAVSSTFAVLDALAYEDARSWKQPPFLLRELGILKPSSFS